MEIFEREEASECKKILYVETIFSTFDRWLYAEQNIFSSVVSYEFCEGNSISCDLWSTRSVFFSIKNPIERFFTITSKKILRVMWKCEVRKINADEIW